MTHFIFEDSKGHLLVADAVSERRARDMLGQDPALKLLAETDTWPEASDWICYAYTARENRRFVA